MMPRYGLADALARIELDFLRTLSSQNARVDLATSPALLGTIQEQPREAGSVGTRLADRQHPKTVEAPKQNTAIPRTYVFGTFCNSIIPACARFLRPHRRADQKTDTKEYRQRTDFLNDYKIQEHLPKFHLIL
ncbi:hypothetical protein WA026_000326 [Henosepilachna vigintioctopunctata]|uniref:Uncharacterized protein n=1 Tax=Henosepilachna vigintioctopunctata TaxID=420089 RepID=A0AAW1V7T8_9CUCU